MKSSIVCIIAAATSALGCASIRSVKAAPGVEGIHYHLPAVVLEARPKEGGTMEMVTRYLPDPEQEYVVSPESFLANYGFEVKIKDGLLESLRFDPDSTKVAAALAEAGGALGKTHFDLAKAVADAEKAAEEQAKKDAAAAKAKQLEAAKAAQDAAQKAVTEAELALKVAVGQLEKLEKLKAQGQPVDDEDIVAAKLAVKEANDRLAAARANLASVKSSMNAVTDAGLEAPGTVLYRLAWREMPAPADAEQPPEGRFVLVASPQRVYQTASLAAELPPVKALIKGANVLRRGDKDGLGLTLVPSEPLAQVVSAKLFPAGGTAPLDDLPPSSQPQSDGNVVVTLHDDTPIGRYRLDLRVRTRSRPERPQQIEAGFEVRDAATK